MNIHYVFDMDGTIANLYGQEEWLQKIESSDPSPYRDAEPLLEMDRFVKYLTELKKQGDTISIVSWTSKTGTKEFNQVVRKTKLEWLAKYKVPYDHCHIIKYGTPKAKYFSKKQLNVLFDDCGADVVGNTKKEYVCFSPPICDINCALDYFTKMNSATVSP